MSDSIPLKTVEANGIAIRYAEIGAGPLVLFCHGWPESWSSWRHQMRALAKAGYRAVAPDMRGYGGTDAPAEIDRYTLLDLVGDQVALVKALGETRAVVVGHDWGAPVAWHCALLRPDLFRAVVGMSVPWTPPSGTDMLTSLEKQGIRDFYIQYFQAPGVADAELDRDPAESLRRIYQDGFGERLGRKKSMIRLRSGGGIEFAAEIQCQSVVEFQRALFAGRVGDVMDGFALCVEDVESAQMTDVGHGGEVVLEAHGCPF